MSTSAGVDVDSECRVIVDTFTEECVGVVFEHGSGVDTGTSIGAGDREDRVQGDIDCGVGVEMNIVWDLILVLIML